MKGYALEALDTGIEGPVTFPGFPGVWMVGESKSLEALGLEEQEAADLVETLGLPLVVVSDAPEANLEATGGLVSNATAASAPLGEQTEPGETLPGPEPAIADVVYPKTHEGLDALAAANDFEFPDDAKTLAEKQLALAQAGITPGEEG